MNNDIKIRVLEEKEYLILTNKTIREIAAHFKISKSTVHKDLQSRLREIDAEDHKVVSKILNDHDKEKHIRGGESTKQKYQKTLIKKAKKPNIML